MLLLDAIQRSLDGRKFQSEKFFPIWFRERGTPYFFLFKKNLSITNIQYPELLSLIRQHKTYKSSRQPVGEVAFHTTAAFTSTLSNIVQPILDSASYTSEYLAEVVAIYWPIVENAIVVDQFFTSCAIFLPPSLDMDIRTICAESGYVHSCGYSLFVRKISKAAQRDLYDSIDRHLEKYPTYRGQLQFIPFTIEDFGTDKEIAYIKDAVQDGLEGVKLRVGKLHMKDNLSLVEVLRDMELRYKNSLIFHGPGNYKEKHPKSSDSTLWLICDKSTNRTNTVVPGRDGYYLCYHQLYYNDSPFHAFDENKPAWLAHTTIPHTLLGAMLNITKPWNRGGATVVSDPFGGTGTTWLEAQKYHTARCISSDINLLFPVLVSDNITFFAMPKERLHEAIAALLELRNHVRTAASQSTTVVQTFLAGIDETGALLSYKQAVEIITKLRGKRKPPFLSFDFPQDIAEEIKQLSYFGRLIFYVALRAELRFQSDYVRGAKEWTTAFVDSADYLLEEMTAHLAWCERAAGEKGTVGLFSMFTGHYSMACGIRYSCLLRAQESALASSNDIRVADARTLKPGSCDVIATDPPYGVNTFENIMSLCRLYSEAIEVFVRALRNDGHLVLCLPMESLSGVQLPVCTASPVVTAQVLRTAELQGREAYIPARSSLPITLPPYYWNSNAITRGILHFRIRDKGNSSMR